MPYLNMQVRYKNNRFSAPTPPFLCDFSQNIARNETRVCFFLCILEKVHPMTNESMENDITCTCYKKFTMTGELLIFVVNTENGFALVLFVLYKILMLTIFMKLYTISGIA